MCKGPGDCWKYIMHSMHIVHGMHNMHSLYMRAVTGLCTLYIMTLHTSYQLFSRDTAYFYMEGPCTHTWNNFHCIPADEQAYWAIGQSCNRSRPQGCPTLQEQTAVLAVTQAGDLSTRGHASHRRVKVQVDFCNSFNNVVDYDNPIPVLRVVFICLYTIKTIVCLLQTHEPINNYVHK